jgi:polyvinyl alcohol dehydrogenase (cytochrome)
MSRKVPHHPTSIIALALSAALATAVHGQADVQDSARFVDLYNHHADLRSSISTENVDNLALAWSVPTEEYVSHAPLVSAGRVFFADWGGNVYSVDRESGEILWKKTVQEKVMKKWPWHGFAGTGTLGEGMLFEVSVEGTGYAIDQETGEVAWQVEVAEDPQTGNVGDLLYYDGLVYVGLSSVEEPLDKMAAKEGKTYPVDFQGKVVALNAKTGEKVWERQLVRAPANGVAVWSSFALDPDTNTLYFTTGNNYTDIATELSDAIVAVDAKTGDYRWADQVLENDIWTGGRPKGPDYDFGGGPQLFEADVDGTMRKLVGAGQKSGIFFTWDRESGERLWTTTVGYGNVGGGIHAEASIGDGGIFIWGNNGYTYGAPPEKHPLDVKSVNAATGEYLWVKNKAQPAVLVSTGYLASDVYFVGSLDGKVRAYDAENGETLWTSDKHGAVGSNLRVDEGMLIWAAGNSWFLS